MTQRPEILAFPAALSDRVASVARELSQAELQLDQTIRHCLGSRHRDGRLREQCIRPLLHDDREWVVPFVFTMLGEYVIEIIRAIEQDLPAHVLPAWQRFAASNPDYVATTRRRAISYWDCYHRAAYPNMADYPALRLIKNVSALIEV